MCRLGADSVFEVYYFSEVELDLELKNTSPAVLDSKVVFTAQLIVSPLRYGTSTLFKYGKLRTLATLIYPAEYFFYLPTGFSPGGRL